MHASLEVPLVIAFGALGLDVLLDGINLALVSDQSLFNLVQLVVDITLQDLVLSSVVANSVVSCLLA